MSEKLNDIIAAVDDPLIYKLLEKCEDVFFDKRTMDRIPAIAEFFGELVQLSLVQLSEDDLRSLKDFGKKSLEGVKRELADRDLSLGMETPKWPPKNLPECYELREAREALTRLERGRAPISQLADIFPYEAYIRDRFAKAGYEVNEGRLPEPLESRIVAVRARAMVLGKYERH